jgi:putative ABC transport system permease protein
VNRLSLAAASLYYHRKTHVGVLLATALCTAVLTGALLADSSVQATLEAISASRLGTVEFALVSRDRLVSAGAAPALAQELGRPTAGLLGLRGTVGTGAQRVNDVHILGVDERFFPLGPAWEAMLPPSEERVYLGEKLARALAVEVGDEVILRIHALNTMPLGTPVSVTSGASIAVRAVIDRILDDREFGSFTTGINQQRPMNAFVSYEFLSRIVELDDRVNVLLVGTGSGTVVPEDLEAALGSVFTASDAGLYARRLDDGMEILSDRIFIDTAIERIALGGHEGFQGEPMLTYFVDSIALTGDAGTGSVIPFSFVSALDSLDLTAELTDREIVLNRWAADDLGAAVGDSVRLSYRVLDETGELVEDSRSLVVNRIVDIDPAHRLFLPDFPGISGADHCRDWDPGFELDVRRIRDRDETYWDEHGGSPKAFVSLSAGRDMWANIYGRATSLRFPGAESFLESLGTSIDPTSIGLRFTSVRDSHRAANRGGVDFGQLFVGLSMFLVAASVVLIGLFFTMGFAQRKPEVGLFIALGLSMRTIITNLLVEHGLIGAVGSALGVVFGIMYNRLLLEGLMTVWTDAVRLERIVQHITPGIVAIGLMSGLGISTLVGFFGLRRFYRTSPIILLGSPSRGGSHRTVGHGRHRRIVHTVYAVTATAAATLVAGLLSQPVSQALWFFASGILTLTDGILALWLWLERRSRVDKGLPSIFSLGLASAARRRVQSMTTAVLLAGGIFVVVAVGANRTGSLVDLSDPGSGTGGFSLVGKTAVPVTGFPPGVDAVGFGVLDGDDASCLNLNRVTHPALLGVDPTDLLGRFSFDTVPDRREARRKAPWSLLDDDLGASAIPAIADQTVLTWGLGLAVGDELLYVDEFGADLRLRIVASIENSILQGNLIVGKAAMKRHFPSVSGTRFFLVDADAPDGTDDGVSRRAGELQRLMGTYGAEFVRADERLMEFYSVENTYLVIFMMLGGFGILLGMVGLGVAAARNIAENRGEHGLLLAVGFDLKSVRLIVMAEHLVPLVGGAAIGIAAALISVLPALLRNRSIPLGFLTATIGGILAVGIVSVLLSTVRADSQHLLGALREE